MFTRRTILTLAVALLPALFWASAAKAIVTGSAEWNWAEYQRDVDGALQEDFSHFFQQYSLLYRERGEIQGGRAGQWNIGLGYEWTTLDATLNDVDADFNDGKILYQGDLWFTPAGLPLSLHAFSHDLARSTPSIVSDNFNSIIDMNIYQGINDGQHLSSGITLLAGGPAANLFGDYREALSALPRLLVDYREDYVRDLQGSEPQHYRSRDLAFVSLNKKQNWFHYRLFEHNDFMDASNDYEEKVWLLGTIDHLNRRQWVNLTNWLSISVDGSLTQRKEWEAFSNDQEETYRLNLFSNAKRRDWTFSNFTTFGRTTYDSGIEKSFNFPLFAMGTIDPANRWRLYFVGTSWENQNRQIFDSSATYSEDSLYAKYQIESNRYAGRILTPEIEVDWIRNTRRGDGHAARAGVELRSDNRMERMNNWLAACSAAWFENNREASTYAEVTARLAASRQLSKTLTVGGSQDLAVGSGDYDQNLTTHIEPTITQNFQDEADRDYQARSVSGTAFRSTTNAYLELTPPGKWQNRFSIYYDHIHVEDDTHQLKLRHDASYSKPQWRMYTRTMLTEGDELSYVWQSEELPSLETSIGDPEVIFSHEAGFAYWPNRYWDAKGEFRALWGDGTWGDAWMLGVEQAFAYHLYDASFMARKKFSFNQKFDYQTILDDNSLWYASLGLNTTYYVTRYLVLESEVGVRHYGLTDENEFEFACSAVTTFRKLQANVSYAYGRADSGTFVPGRREQRWEIGLKKYF